MESKWGYHLTQKAVADLDDIVGYIAAELSNPTAASDFLDKLQETIEESRSFPESGAPVINEFVPNTEVRKKLIGNYIMYYLPNFTQKMIFVLRIVYSRRNIDEILRQLNV